MDSVRRKQLEQAGFRVGSAAEFLGLSPAEETLVELKVGLSTSLREWRTREQVSQTELARRLGSSQSRVAKMEAGDPGVSLDMLFRALLSLGANPRQLGDLIASAPRGADPHTAGSEAVTLPTPV